MTSRSDILKLNPFAEELCLGYSLEHGRCLNRTHGTDCITAWDLLEEGSRRLELRHSDDETQQAVTDLVLYNQVQLLLCRENRQRQEAELVEQWRREGGRFYRRRLTRTDGEVQRSSSSYSSSSLSLRDSRARNTNSGVSISRPSRGVGSSSRVASLLPPLPPLAPLTTPISSPAVHFQDYHPIQSTPPLLQSNIQPLSTLHYPSTTMSEPVSTTSALSSQLPSDDGGSIMTSYPVTPSPSLSSSTGTSAATANTGMTAPTPGHVAAAHAPRKEIEGDCGICMLPLDIDSDDSRLTGFVEGILQYADAVYDSDQHGEITDDDNDEEEKEERDDDDVEKEDDILYCKARCGTNYHNSCINTWLSTFPDYRMATCPTCRALWVD